MINPAILIIANMFYVRKITKPFKWKYCLLIACLMYAGMYAMLYSQGIRGLACESLSGLLVFFILKLGAK